MDLQQHFSKIMSESVNMALATSVENRPNVRVVTFGWDKARPDKLYFCTFTGCQKIEEFSKNSQVACIPLPQCPEAGAQVRVFGEVKESAITLQELTGMIAPKAPDDVNTMEDGGDMLKLYEVEFAEAWVTVGMSEAQRYTVR